jgi:acetyltransferase-like isoleucine patch superfamily enzyme
MNDNEFRKRFFDLMEYSDNPYHPLVWINGRPEIGEGTYIGGFTDINAKGARLVIGAHCDIASFTAINVADTHLRAIGLDDPEPCRDIIIGDYVYIGSHSVIMGGTRVGQRSVIGAGTILRGEEVPPYSLAIGNPVVIKKDYFKEELAAKGLLAAHGRKRR